MLIRVAPRFFQADTGDTVTIAAVAQNNNGSEGATFQYGGVILGALTVQNHPACQFVVVHGVDTFAAMMLFDVTAPSASYDFFEVDAAGNFLPLQVNAPAAAGMFTQFQIDGKPVAALAAATLAHRFAMSSATAAARPALTGAAGSGRTAGAGKRPGTAKRKKKTAKQPSRSGTTARGRR
jgi:hypothetical protein